MIEHSAVTKYFLARWINYMPVVTRHRMKIETIISKVKESSSNDLFCIFKHDPNQCC